MKVLPLPRLTDADLHLLQVFMTVARCGGFSAAQAELNVGQPTISAQMATLETRLSMRLCERGRSRFQLTAEGKGVYEAAVQLFSSLDMFRDKMGELRGSLIGDIHLGLVDATITNPRLNLAKAIGSFRSAAAEVHIHLHIASPIELEAGLTDSQYDLTIGPLQRRRKGISHIELGSEKQRLYCGREHAFFSRAPLEISEEEAINADFVARGYVSDWSQSAPHADAFTVRATAYQMESIAQMILSGRFVGYLPEHFAQLWVDRQELKAIRPDVFDYEARFFASYRSGRQSLLVDTFIKHVQTTGLKPSALPASP